MNLSPVTPSETQQGDGMTTNPAAQVGRGKKQATEFSVFDLS